MVENEKSYKHDDDSKNDSKTTPLDTIFIYNKIAPYLSDPEPIRELLEKNSTLSRERMIALIESKLESANQIMLTDLRILLNAI